MKEIKGLYSIEQYDPAPGRGPGNYGFSIVLAYEVAASIATAPRIEEHFVAHLERHLKACLTEYDRDFGRIEFHEDSWLISAVYAGNDCACFFTTRRDFRAPTGRDVRYEPHNIDCADQAAAILSTWLMWFNTLIHQTDFKVPMYL